MNIELLNQKITVQKNTITTDTVGNHTNTWATFYICHATVSGENRGEESAAGTTTDHSDADFTIRWCAAAKVITPDGYRVLFGGEVYNIIGIDHMNYKRKAVKLRCRKERD